MSPGSTAARCIQRQDDAKTRTQRFVADGIVAVIAAPGVAGVKDVDSTATVDIVIAIAAYDGVDAGATIDLVLAGTAEERIDQTDRA
ncbi:hypothetical protein [Phyllobacterium sophorae]|uniref:hypothetical protein n=1 Tax=Phyllobacterium sophorae TaxID=1520277 RepID=UPI0011B1E15B|nr:hypothetical protein [Phyllobacterium sophorae]